MSDSQPSAASGLKLQGRAWKAVVNGQRSLNATRQSITLTGTIRHAEEWSTIFDVMHDLAEHIEQHTKDMEIKDSFQITLYPPPQAQEEARHS
jgi:acetylornithine deacetylase/succinyl-diaminopimelate desuccinylase-like protein